MAKSFYIGVDVGTSSARAALVSKSGEIITHAAQSISIFEPEEGFFEQSSNDIWHSCCKAVRMVMEGVDPGQVKGVGFDATCSLVILDKTFEPLPVSPSGKSDMNIIMWMDHRASKQAEIINAKQHEVLRNVGGKISLEMQTPKLLWLKENLSSETWERASHFFDLPDYLTWKASGSLSRSLCSIVCKWTYQANKNHCGWRKNFFEEIGLGDLCTDNFSKIGNIVLSPGEACGNGLTAEAAADLGLKPGTPVGTSLIDAHAGGLGTMGCSVPSSCEPNLKSVPQTSRLALVSGTSTCHMAVSEEPLFVEGVWGPYFSAMIPGLWLNEGGQSAAGKLIDNVLKNHPSYSWLVADAELKKKDVHDYLCDVLEFAADRQGLESFCEVTRDLHVWPDYHGNRSPLADSSLKGMVSGLSLASGVEDLAIQYLATVQALSYGTRHIIESMEKSGHNIKLLLCCGGLSKNPLYVQAHADITGLPILLPNVKEAVLLGASILGACSSGDFSSIQEAMTSMGGEGTIIYPIANTKRYHNKKYKVFLRMVEHQKIYKDIMNLND